MTTTTDDAQIIETQHSWPHSDDAPTDELWPALVRALGRMTDITRARTAQVESERTNTRYSYRYADLGDVLGHVRPILAAEQLALVQHVSHDNHAVTVRTVVLHAAGASFCFDPLTLPAGGTVQQIGSAITYARRYSLMAALGLATDDDDGATATPPKPVRKTSTKPRSEAEAEIRRMLDVVPKEIATKVRTAFKEQFGCTLTALDVDRHDEALQWVTDFGNRLDDSEDGSTP